MKDMRIYMSVMAAGLFGALLAGCTKTEEIYIDELYQKAYITADFYPQDTGEYTRNDVMKDPSVALDSKNTLVTQPGGVVITESGEKSQEISFCTVHNVKSDLTGTLTIHPEAGDYIANYNAERGLTDEDAYKLLGDTFYHITNATSVIRTGNRQGEQKFAVEFAEDLSELTPGHYLVPFVLSVDDPGIEVSGSRGIFNLVFDYNYTDERDPDVEDIRILTKDEFTWQLLAGSTYDGNYNNLFDADNSTFWMSNPDYPRIKITFNEPVPLKQMAFVAFTYYSWYYRFGYSKFAYTLADGTQIDYPLSWYEYPNMQSDILFYYDVTNDVGKDAMVKEAWLDLDSYYGYVGLTDIYFIVKK